MYFIISSWYDLSKSFTLIHLFLIARAYSDADHDSDPTDRKSVTGFYIFLGDFFISWKSKKQSIVSHSSAEAEYHAMTSTTKEIVWLRWLLADMRVSLSHPTPMYCDNQSSIQIAYNSIFLVIIAVNVRQTLCSKRAWHSSMPKARGACHGGRRCKGQRHLHIKRRCEYGRGQVHRLYHVQERAFGTDEMCKLSVGRAWDKSQLCVARTGGNTSNMQDTRNGSRGGGERFSVVLLLERSVESEAHS